MKQWVTAYTPFLVNGKRNGYINPGTVVEEEQGWFIHNGAMGLIDPACVEPYVESLPKNCVDVSDIETPDPNDAAQYVMWQKLKQTNMCGELSVCYAIQQFEGQSIPLSMLLTNWERQNPALYKRIFNSVTKAAGTWYTDLIQMFAVFGYEAKPLPFKKITPHSLKAIQFPIIGVKMDGISGRLRGSGVGHWVTVKEVVPERIGYGYVQLYNPFPNREEWYSWTEFVASVKTPYGAYYE